MSREARSAVWLCHNMLYDLKFILFYSGTDRKRVISAVCSYGYTFINFSLRYQTGSARHKKSSTTLPVRFHSLGTRKKIRYVSFSICMKFPHSRIMKMQEAGLITKWKKEWLEISDTCKSESKSTHTSLDVFHFVVFYGGFMILSFIALCGETFYDVYRKTRNKRSMNFK